MRTLLLTDLSPAIPALTSEIGAYFVQACYVCFALNNHPARLQLQVSGAFSELFTVEWPGAVSNQMKRAWNDPDEATEQGAYGIAILLIRALTSHTVIERSRKGSGFDYWIGDVTDDTSAPFERKARLEASGIAKGTNAMIRSRVVRKLNQTKASDGVYPAYIVVVEFSRLLAWVEVK